MKRARRRSAAAAKRKASQPIDAVKSYLRRISKTASAKKKSVIKSARAAMVKLYGR